MLKELNMMKISEESRRLLRKIFLGLAGSAALGFQGCVLGMMGVYGPPPAYISEDELQIEILGKVLSKTTNEPISGIKVSINDRSAFTRKDGTFNIELPLQDFYTFNFEDGDGSFQAQTVILEYDRQNPIFSGLDWLIVYLDEE